MKRSFLNKKTIYIIASMFLGFLLSVIVHAKLEIWYIEKIIDSGMAPVSFGNQEFLPPLASLLLAIFGLIFGYIVGQRWWQIVYVEKRHWRMRKK
jgi:hypothetical protein